MEFQLILFYRMYASTLYFEQQRMKLILHFIYLFNRECVYKYFVFYKQQRGRLKKLINIHFPF